MFLVKLVAVIGIGIVVVMLMHAGADKTPPAGAVRPVATSAAPPAPTWEAHRVTDHLRGDVGLGVSVVGTANDGKGARRAKLTVNCAGNSTTVFVEAGFVTLKEGSPVSYSIDSGPVRREHWSICKSNDCVGLWHGRGIPFAKALMDAHYLKLVIERPHLSNVDVEFRVKGADTAFKPIGQACGWLPKP